MAPRTIRKLHPAVRDDIRDLQTRRPLPNPALTQLDPFLFLNHHGPQTYPPGNRGLPFGPHPHRGFETVTFILEGDIAHRDSGGHESVIDKGGVQWMTAGRGLIHEEVSSEAFKQRGGGLEVLQLWLNLPARLKMVEPRYVGLQKEQLPSFPADDGRVTVNLFSGTWEGSAGPFPSISDVHLMSVELAAGGRVRLPVSRGRNVLLYVVRGALRVQGQPVGVFQLVEMNDDGDAIDLEAETAALLLFGHAEPSGEPIVAHGPFVMNTREEIAQAIHDYHAGKFGPLLDAH